MSTDLSGGTEGNA